MPYDRRTRKSFIQKTPSVPEAIENKAYQTYLTALNKTLAGIPAASRHTGRLEDILWAAVAVNGLNQPSATWGKQLFGNNSPGRSAFNVFSELLTGRYNRLFWLPTFFRREKTPPQWGTLGRSLEMAAKSAANPRWENAAVAILFLSLPIRFSGNSVFDSVSRVQRAPKPLREELVRVTLASRKELALRTQIGVLGQVLRTLYGVDGRRLHDPVLVGLLAQLTPSESFKRALMKKLEKTNPQAVKAIEQEAASRTDDPEALLFAAKNNVKAGRLSAALDCLHRAEALGTNHPTDARNTVWHGLIRKANAGDARLLNAEIAFRKQRAEKDDSPGAWFVYGRLLANAGRKEPALEVFRSMFAKTRTPGSLFEWAKIEPETAWKALLAFKPKSPAEKRLFAQSSTIRNGLWLGIGVNQYDEAVNWATRMVSLLGLRRVSPYDLGMIGGLVAVKNREMGLQLLGSQKNDHRNLQIVQGVLYPLVRMNVRAYRQHTPEARVAQVLHRHVAAKALWDIAAERAVTFVPEVTASFGPGELWSAVMRAIPSEPDPAMAARIADLRTVSLEWIDAHPQFAKFAVPSLMNASFRCAPYPLNKEHSPVGATLFQEMLRRAKEQGIAVNRVTYQIVQFFAYLRQCKASTDDIARFERRIGEVWPVALAAANASTSGRRRR
ncbi:MAG: hypothetical protein GXP31_06665 [Kiritimatiellaeota bacterium]|nr:hypothetical protein [Kiritimatiellota bacterium]